MALHGSREREQRQHELARSRRSRASSQDPETTAQDSDTVAEAIDLCKDYGDKDAGCHGSGPREREIPPW
jgi:hypothetical protein